MNEQAQITSVKARKEAKADFTTEFAEIQLQDADVPDVVRAQATRSASIPWGDGTRDEKIAASAATIDQFTAVYMEFIPAYLDWLTEEYGDMNDVTAQPARGRRESAPAGAEGRQEDQRGHEENHQHGDEHQHEERHRPPDRTLRR